MKSKMYVPVMSGMFKKYRNQYMKSFSKIGDMHPVLCIERTFDQEKQKKNIGVLEENIRYLDSCGIAPFVPYPAGALGLIGGAFILLAVCKPVRESLGKKFFI